MRSQGLNPDDYDHDPVFGFNGVGSSSIPPRSPEDRAQDLDDVLNWLKNKAINDDKFDSSGMFR